MEEKNSLFANLDYRTRVFVVRKEVPIPIQRKPNLEELEYGGVEGLPPLGLLRLLVDTAQAQHFPLLHAQRVGESGHRLNHSYNCCLLL
jgi:hypothetical protein